MTTFLLAIAAFPVLGLDPGIALADAGFSLPSYTNKASIIAAERPVPAKAGGERNEQAA
jgi:hypothetical protein